MPFRESAIQNSPLPPSVEKAYYDKCTELKRRLNDIEDANDAARLRKIRLARAIKKMRLERAFLLEQLAKSQRIAADDADSDKSSSAPPTPRDRPPRLKRAYQRRSSPANDVAHSAASPSQAAAPTPAPISPASRFAHARDRRQPVLPDQRESIPTVIQLSTTSQAVPATQASRTALAADISPSDLNIEQPVPLIYYLPIGTNVALLPGSAQPKPRPWTIRDLEPRHHVFSGFNELSGIEQHDLIFVHGYLPYDLYGNAVICRYQPERRAYRHVFAGESAWTNPVKDDRRTDAPTELGEGKGPIRALSTKEEVRTKRAKESDLKRQLDGKRPSARKAESSTDDIKEHTRTEPPQKNEGRADLAAIVAGSFSAANR